MSSPPWSAAVPRDGWFLAALAPLALLVGSAGGDTPVAPTALTGRSPAAPSTETLGMIGWGWSAHELVTRAAIEALPPDLRRDFEARADFLARHSIDPDLWRREEIPEGLCPPDRSRPVLAGAEPPRHFLDADSVDAYPFRAIPRDFEAYRRLAGDRLEDWGTGPWAIAAYAELLTEALRAGDVERLECRSAILAHYVADFSQPLHLTVNYDGQLSGLDGLHARFERALVDFYGPVLAAAVRRRAPRGVVLEDPLEAVFEMLRVGYPDSHALLRADLLAQRRQPLAAGTDGRDSPAYMRELWAQAGDLAAERLAYGAEMVASYWLTAWESAGRPALPGGDDGRR